MINKKKAMPHITVEDKGPADLFFEFLEPKDRKEFFNDLTGKDKPTINLPDFGKIDKKGPEISNKVKEFNNDEISDKTEKFIEFFTKNPKKPSSPYLDYNDQQHKYELKPKYDIEKMIKEFTEKHRKN